MVYISLVVTSILAILGLISKTKKDDKPNLLNKLTPFGLIVLLLLILSLAFSIYSQKDKEDKAENERIAIATKAKEDSTKNKYQFLLDSTGHSNTISLLTIQRKNDSLKILTDSLRFNVTLDNFGVQLNKQNNTLQSLTELQYPLFPLKIKFRFTINLNSDLNNALSKQYEEVKKICNNTNTAIFNFENSNFSINNHSLYETKVSSELLEAVMNFYQLSIPEPMISFYQNPGFDNETKNKNEFYHIDGFLPLYSIESGKLLYTFCKNYEISSLKYYPHQNFIKGTILFEPLIPSSFANQFTSIYKLKNGCYIMGLRLDKERYFNPKNELSINYISFYCGDKNPQLYHSSLGKSEFRMYKGYRYYYRTIQSLINKNDDPTADLLFDSD